MKETMTGEETKPVGILRCMVMMREVASAREAVSAALDNANLCEEILNQTPEWVAWQEAKAAADALKDAQREAENAARAEILKLSSTTGDKKPVPGASVKVFPTLRYDEEQALAWCKDHAPDLLVTSIDRKRFEKVAVELRAPVEVIEEPRAQIASDLSMYATESDTREETGE